MALVFEYISDLLANYPRLEPQAPAAYYDDVRRREEYIELTSDAPDDRQHERLYNHQLMLIRMLSPLSGVRTQLVYHGMGLGKTIMYLGIINEWRPHIENPPLILVRNSKLTAVLKREIVRASREIFMNGEFPEDATPQLISSIIKKNYNIKTYHKFATILQGIPEDADYMEAVRDLNLFNTIIIADEVQHLKNINNLAMYDLVKQCFKTAGLSSCVYLFTGTPMIDDAAEFENIINLLTPEEARPIQLQFDANHQLINANEVKSGIAGYISYLRRASSGFNIKYDMNQPAESLTYFSPALHKVTKSGIYISPLTMTQFQSFHYYRALKQDGAESGPLRIDLNIPNLTLTYLGHKHIRILMRIEATAAADDLASAARDSIQRLQEHTKYELSAEVVVQARAEIDMTAACAALKRVRGVHACLSDSGGVRAAGHFDVIILYNLYNNQNIQYSELLELRPLNADFYLVIMPSIPEAAQVPHDFVRVFAGGFKYETEMDRFVRGLELEMESSENLDDVNDEFIPEAQVRNKQSAAYSNACQASLFVYPNGSYGRSGELTYMRASYNARDMHDWLTVARRYPPNCTIYADIVRTWTQYVEQQKWRRTIIYSSSNNNNIMFLIKVLNSVGFVKYTSNLAASNINNTYYLARYCAGTNLEEFKQEFGRILRAPNVHVIFLIGKEDIVDVLEIGSAANILKLGAAETCVQRSLFDDYFARQSAADMLDLVKRHSIKYYEILNHLLNKPGKVYIYSELISGSGLVVLMRLLELMGYSNVADSEGSDALSIARLSKKPRYAFVSSKLSDAAMDSILSVYNDARNVDGAYIRIFMGTETVSEGISLYDTDTMFDLTANWNIASLEQAEQRICRIGAFRQLKQSKKMKDTDLIPVYINRMAALPRAIAEPGRGEARNVINSWVSAAADPSRAKSIDYYMYTTCLNKDIRIKQVERVCKTAAIDCQLNKARMRVGAAAAADYTRDCEYNKCEYDCDFVTPEGTIITDTYREFYAEDLKKDVRAAIIEYFDDSTRATYAALVRRVFASVMQIDDPTEFRDEDIKPIQSVIHHVIYDLIVNKVPAFNRGKILCYDLNTFYLCEDRGEKCAMPQYWYTERRESIVPIVSRNLSTKQVRANLENEYKIELNEMILRVLQNKSQLNALLNHDKFKLFVDENIRALVMRAVESAARADMPGAVVVLNHFKQYIVQFHEYIFITLNDPYLVYNTEAAAPKCMTIQDYHDKVSADILNVLLDYMLARLNQLRATVAALALAAAPESPVFVYGTYVHTDGQDQFNVYVSDKDYSEDKLRRDFDEYVRGARTFPVYRGIKFETLDSKRKKILRALMKLNDKQLLSKKEAIDFMTKNGLILFA
jgi:hypothetical protein